MNEWTHFFIKIYLSHLTHERVDVFVVWEMDGDTYIQREDFFFPYLLPGARGCQRLHPLASSSETSSVRLRVHRSTVILCTSSKSDHAVFITWSPSGYTPVRPECPDTPSSSCLLIKTWQLTKAHGVTRNEPKIRVICYIILPLFVSIKLTSVLISLRVFSIFPELKTMLKGDIFQM